LAHTLAPPSCALSLHAALPILLADKGDRGAQRSFPEHGRRGPLKRRGFGGDALVQTGERAWFGGHDGTTPQLAGSVGLPDRPQAWRPRARPAASTTAREPSSLKSTLPGWFQKMRTSSCSPSGTAPSSFRRRSASMARTLRATSGVFAVSAVVGSPRTLK